MNAAAQRALDTKATDANARRDQLITEYLPMVTAVAAHIRRSIPVHVEMDDLANAGVMGLLEAASKYEEDKNVAFPVYARHRIRGAILDSLRQMDWAPRDLRKRYKQMEAVTRDLAAKLKRDPSELEIAQAMGLDARRWQALMVDFRGLAVAAAQMRPETSEQPVQDAAASPKNTPDQVFARSELKHKLLSAMATLPERYRQVVSLYYERDMTMKEIGGLLGVNESRVSQIHKSALERMQSVMSQTGICSAAAF